MGTEDNHEDRPSEEMVDRKRGSGQVASGKNPRGAGRPTNEWRQYQREKAQFEEWKEAKHRGEFVGYAEIIKGLAGHGKGDNKRRGKGDGTGLLERIIKITGVEKILNQVDFDVVKKTVADVVPVVAPVVSPLIPYVALPFGLFIGVTLWYMLEEAEQTDTYSREEWDALTPARRNIYYIVNGTDLRKEDKPEDVEEGFDWWSLLTFSPLIILQPLFEKDEDDNDVYIMDEEVEIVKATRAVMPQFIHGVMDWQNDRVKDMTKIAQFFGIEDFIFVKIQATFPELMKKYFEWIQKILSIFKKKGVEQEVTPGVSPDDKIEFTSGDEEGAYDPEPQTEHTFDIDPISLEDKLAEDPPPPPPEPQEDTPPPFERPDTEEEEEEDSTSTSEQEEEEEITLIDETIEEEEDKTFDRF